MPVLIEERLGGIARLTMNRPEQMNALSPDLLQALMDTMRRLSEDSKVRAILLTGAGKAFCAGGDVKAMAALQDYTLEQRLEDLRWKQTVARLVHSSPKVVIAALNGAARGAGLGLALACDFRIAARSASLGSAFASIGLSGDYGSSWTLSRLLGPAKARELLMLNKSISADDAATLGLVTSVVDDVELADAAAAFAASISSGPTAAFALIKLNLAAAAVSSFEEMLEIEAVHQSRAAMTTDHREARSAFADKRKPVFRGV